MKASQAARPEGGGRSGRGAAPASRLAARMGGDWARRAWIYQRERFPVAGHGLLILAFSSCAVSFSFMLRGGSGQPAWASYGLAFASCFLFFLQLRIADEFKDCEEDRRYRPYRPVPRGVVTLRELGWVAAAGMATQWILAWMARPSLGILLIGVWIYLGAMSREFFVRAWIKRRPVTYLWTHMLIMPLVDFYATACDWLYAGQRAPSGLGWFLALSFGNGLVLELGRKIRAPAMEEEGVETYSRLWGRGRAVAVWMAAALGSAWCAWQAARAIAFGIPAAALGVVLSVAAAACGWAFWRAPSPERARTLERLSGIWVLLFYLCLGLAPLAWRFWQGSLP